MRHHEDDDIELEEKSTAQMLDEANALIKETEEFLKTKPQTALQIEDHSELANKYLTDEAKTALSKKATQLIVKHDDGRVFTCIYLGARLLKTNVEKGVERLALIANDLAKEGLIHSALTPISSLDLAITSMTFPNCVVILFVLVPIESVNDVKARFNTNFFPEGGMPEPMEDVSIKPEEGEFVANIKISHALAMMSDYGPAENVLQTQIDQYLAVLPKGTTVTKKVQCAIQGLYLEYDVYFNNPLLKRVKKVELNYTRMAEMSNGIFEQFNLFRGITYFDSEGKEI